MVEEIIYTSAPRGLKAGSSGFCTVASTPGMARTLATLLESLSGYRHLAEPGSAGGNNPVLYSYLRARLGGRSVSIFSRVADAGSDYSGRTNKIAHHVAFSGQGPSQAGPVAVQQQVGFHETAWSGEPRVIQAGRAIPALPSHPAPCTYWQQTTGDAGWGGVVAARLAADRKAQVWIICPAKVDTLRLLGEALALLPEADRWNVTYSTFFTKLAPGLDCRIRCVVDGTAEANQVRRRHDLKALDLTKPPGIPPKNIWTEAARTGHPPQQAPPLPAGGPTTGRAAAAVATGDQELTLDPLVEDLGELELEPPMLPGSKRAAPGVPMAGSPFAIEARRRHGPGSRPLRLPSWIFRAAVLLFFLVVTAGAGAWFLWNNVGELIGGLLARNDTLMEREEQQPSVSPAGNREEGVGDAPPAADQKAGATTEAEKQEANQLSQKITDLQQELETLQRNNTKLTEEVRHQEQHTETAVTIATAIAENIAEHKPDEISNFVTYDQLTELKQLAKGDQALLDSIDLILMEIEKQKSTTWFDNWESKIGSHSNNLEQLRNELTNDSCDECGNIEPKRKELLKKIDNLIDAREVAKSIPDAMVLNYMGTDAHDETPGNTSWQNEWTIGKDVQLFLLPDLENKDIEVGDPSSTRDLVITAPETSTGITEDILTVSFTSPNAEAKIEPKMMERYNNVLQYSVLRVPVKIAPSSPKECQITFCPPDSVVVPAFGLDGFEDAGQLHDFPSNLPEDKELKTAIKGNLFVKVNGTKKPFKKDKDDSSNRFKTEPIEVLSYLPTTDGIGIYFTIKVKFFTDPNLKDFTVELSLWDELGAKKRWVDLKQLRDNLTTLFEEFDRNIPLELTWDELYRLCDTQDGDERGKEIKNLSLSLKDKQQLRIVAEGEKWSAISGGVQNVDQLITYRDHRLSALDPKKLDTFLKDNWLDFQIGVNLYKDGKKEGENPETRELILISSEPKGGGG